MPRWQREKSYLTGSRGSSARSDRVMSAAIRQPGLVSLVSRRHRPTRMTWVSSGTISCAGRTRDQMPRSTRSMRTIQRRNRFRRLQAPPEPRAARRSRRRRAWRASSRRPRSDRGSSARVENDSSACSTVSACGVHAFGEEALDRAAALQHLAQHPQQRDQVDAARPAVHEREQRRAVHLGFEAADELRRVRRPSRRAAPRSS